MSGLKTLDAAGRRMLIDDVLTFIPLFALGSRQSLAFNRQKSVEVYGGTSFDPDSGATGSSSEINLARRAPLVRLFNPKLKDIPASRVAGGAGSVGVVTFGFPEVIKSANPIPSNDDRPGIVAIQRC